MESLPPVRQYGFPEEIFEPFWLSDNDIALKSHPGYSKAKGKVIRELERRYGNESNRNA